MFYNTTVQSYQTIIPAGFPGGTLIIYKIIAHDNAGNWCVNDNFGLYYIYTVIGGSEWLTIYSSPTEVTFTVYGISYVTPWSGCYNENDSVSLVMPETHNGHIWSHWLEDGDPNRIKTITLPGTTYTAVYTEPPIGGYSFPIKGYTAEKPLTLYLALIGILTVSFTIAKRRKKQQN